MEDYNEEINIKSKLSESGFRTMKRLFLGRGTGRYGFIIVDQKAQNNQHGGPIVLWRGSSYKEGEKVVISLREGHQDPSKLNTHPVILPSRIIKLEEKHGDRYFSIPSVDDLLKLSIEIITERKGQGWFQTPVKPADIDITEENLDSLPESLQLSAKLTFDNYNKDMRMYRSLLDEHDELEKAINGDGMAAWNILSNRQGYEYEEYEIIDPQIVK